MIASEHYEWEIGTARKRLDALLLATVNMPAKDEPLPHGYFDHPLGGEWNDHCDCHIRPDLVLIYRKPDETSLEVVRLGSHSELGLQRPAVAEFRNGRILEKASEKS